MINLELNENKIQEIKYELKEEKTVIFKLKNSNLEDVIVVEKNKTIDKQCESDKAILENNLKEKGIKLSIGNLKNIDTDRCQKLMGKLDNIPYKAYEKIGELYTNNNVDDAEGRFINESDPYVVNDDRETPKQKILKKAVNEKLKNIKEIWKDTAEEIKKVDTKDNE